MSVSYELWPLTNYPDALDKSNSNIRQAIVDFENRNSSTDPRLYHVLSEDVKVLQQAVFAIEETLGVLPQSSFQTVNARIEALEDYDDLDKRYGGSTWGTNISPTIMGHIHDGTQAPKVNLVNHVTGKLAKANINLDRAKGGIVGTDIALNSSTNQTVANKFNDKLDKAGGTIQGTGAYLTVDGLFNSHIYQEQDAYKCVPSSSATGSNISDSKAFSGTARRALSTNGKGNVLQYTSTLRYGSYSLGLRMKVSSISSHNAIGKVKIYSGSSMVKEMQIVPANFTGTDYEMFYVAFSHRNNRTIKIYVEWYGTSIKPAISCNLTMDSLVITPLHITAYDLDN